MLQVGMVFKITYPLPSYPYIEIDHKHTFYIWLLQSVLVAGKKDQFFFNLKIGTLS